MSERVFDQSCDSCVSQSRALVPLTVQAEPAAAPFAAFRPDARFVTHLIATATHLPQTRALRRAAPLDGAAAYSTVSRCELPVPANDRLAQRVA